MKYLVGGQSWKFLAQGTIAACTPSGVTLTDPKQVNETFARFYSDHSLILMVNMLNTIESPRKD